MHLVQNNLFFLGKNWAWREITKAELANLSRDTVKDSIRMVFSGVNVGTFEQKLFQFGDRLLVFERKVTQSKCMVFGKPAPYFFCPFFTRHVISLYII